MTPAELELIVPVMVRLRVQKCGTVELHPSAFAPAPAVEEQAPAQAVETLEEIAFASSVPVTKWEKEGREPD